MRDLSNTDMSLDHKSFDGKALPPPYEPPVYDGPEPSMEVENGKLCKCPLPRAILFTHERLTLLA